MFYAATLAAILRHAITQQKDGLRYSDMSRASRPPRACRDARGARSRHGASMVTEAGE